MKSILFLGGGQLGIPVLTWAREIGFQIIVNDRNPRSPGSALADVQIHFDSTDARSIATWAAGHNDRYHIQYCHCGSDFGLLTAYCVHEALGLPHSPLVSIISGLDKNLMKRSWEHSIRPHFPASTTIFSDQDCMQAGASLGWPLIIKPSSGSGSQGVSLAHNKEEAIQCFHEAARYAKTGTIIAEQFIDGTHHDVNGLFWDGTFYPCGIGDRFFTPFPYCVPHHGYFPTSLDARQRRELYSLLEKGARSMGISWGPVKADCVVDRNDACLVYEISPRFHGDVFTSNVMGFLHETNPLYQFLSWIFHGRSLTFVPFEDAREMTGGWKTVFTLSEKDRFLSRGDVGLFLKGTRERDVVRNNEDILGLAWAWARSRDEINIILKMVDHD
ncbi:MAG TPA: ATP-grasp domain-containing protein [Deltaproteobacteria bacterium]|mgnify:CR=1 FL=1|nr:ATP-grasp domain-containing protein [Deltaproteobacteria bacterium]HPR53745.1 ATP-grasp domain-containing protein [Deltaproteobacteria bacterium]HXK46762.1 ATP-grasp domain-containing protein [Deltaproteobacteria bacterium]